MHSDRGRSFSEPSGRENWVRFVDDDDPRHHHHDKLDSACFWSRTNGMEKGSGLRGVEEKKSQENEEMKSKHAATTLEERKRGKQIVLA